MAVTRIQAAQHGVALRDAHFARTVTPARGAASKRGAKRGAKRGSKRRRPRGALVSQGSVLATDDLSQPDRLRLLDGLEQVIEGVFTHLPLKRARYGFDPVQRLRILRTQIGELSSDAFHYAVAEIITRLRDAHTRYQGPTVLERKVAALPFLIEMIGSIDAPSYIVTKVGGGVPAPFRPGVVLEYWNGVPIDRAVQLYSDREVGGRPDSERANAVLTLTMRSLQYGPPPDEHWVIIGYRTITRAGKPTGPAREIKLAWRVVDPGQVDAMLDDDTATRVATPSAKRQKALRRARAVNLATEAVRKAKMLMFAPNSLMAQSAAAKPKRRRSPAKSSVIETSIPQTLRITSIDGPGGPYAHLRIWAFDADPDQFINELLRVIPLLPERGCIIDLRGNPGGYIWAAEQALQLFTPNSIQPTRFSVLATPFTRAMAALPSMRDELAPWRDSLEAAVRNGELYAQPIPITNPADCNAIGQRYSGPVVLVADATTYSSGDLFSAGFVDNQLGPFLCVGNATGAGGANVWEYGELQQALRGSPLALPTLPGGIGLTMAFRRATRSGISEGLPIEDIGVAGTPYAMTRDDVLHGNRDLIARCIKLLRDQPLTVLRAAVSSAERTLDVETRGLDRLDVELDGHPFSSQALSAVARVSITYTARTRVVELTGYEGGEVRQRRRMIVRR
jgi:hypothetical protein